MRNFGLVTVTGQQAGACRRRALRSRDVWAEVAPLAGIPIEQERLLLVVRRPEAMAVLEAFRATEMSEDRTLLDTAETRGRHGGVLAGGENAGSLWSPHERRVESRHAMPRPASFLQSRGVAFRRRTLVRGVEPGRAETSASPLRAGRVVVCSGDDLLTLFPERITAMEITRCRLHMLKLRPRPGFRLPGAVMSDLSLVR